MLAPERITFRELADRLSQFERKYGYSTIEFYQRYRGGELGDDEDLMMWAGLFCLYLNLHPVRQLMS